MALIQCPECSQQVSTEAAARRLYRLVCWELRPRAKAPALTRAFQLGAEKLSVMKLTRCQSIEARFSGRAKVDVPIVCGDADE